VVAGNESRASTITVTCRVWIAPAASDLVLLCGHHHHRLIHRGTWTVRLAADDLPDFIPPPLVDVTQSPRRNRYHRRN
jgi:hypothetical protein